MLNTVFAAEGEVGVDLLPIPIGFSNSSFAGEEMIDSEVIKEEITSGEAGCICTRFVEWVDGPWSDFRRACCRVGLGTWGAFVDIFPVR